MIEIIHASEVITNEYYLQKLLNKKGFFNGFRQTYLTMTGDVFISAGIPGFNDRSNTNIRTHRRHRQICSGPIIPTKEADTATDAGFNTVCKPINYFQFGIIGSIYMREMFNIKNPTVGLIMLVLKKKGNETIKQAFNLLSESGLNFIGNIEGREIPEGEVKLQYVMVSLVMCC